VRPRVVPDVTGHTLRKVISENVDMAGSVLWTDEGACPGRDVTCQARYEDPDGPPSTTALTPSRVARMPLAFVFPRHGPRSVQ
jgi:hypothetical protein